jgi:hypothetical protein
MLQIDDPIQMGAELRGASQQSTNWAAYHLNFSTDLSSNGAWARLADCLTRPKSLHGGPSADGSTKYAELVDRSRHPEVSPTTGIKVPINLKFRDRVLSDDEIRAIWQKPTIRIRMA